MAKTTINPNFGRYFVVAQLALILVGIRSASSGNPVFYAQNQSAPPPTGYFVLTSGSWNGNLGGISGANSKCLTDLTTYTWLGKSNATLDSTHVKAFLCDGTTCNNLQASTIYKFAVSNDTTLGGSYFITDSSGLGPNDSADWSGTSYFGPGDKFYWTGRDTGTVTQWPSAATDTAHCSAWTATATATKGRRGYNVDTSQARWNNLTPGCNSVFYLACFVNP